MKILAAFILTILYLEIPAQKSFTCSHRHQHFEKAVSAERSDTVDVNHIDLFLDMTRWDEQELYGHANVSITAIIGNLDRVVFDLEAFIVDSVKLEGQAIEFTHNAPLLVCWPTENLGIGESYSIDIFYHGQPFQDASGWGGFYWQSNYAFNLGVGFDADPHSYGRAWFPCFDNFVERSTYSTAVLTNEGRTAYCGGIRSSVETVGLDSLLTTWELDEEIPSYLASIAVSDYVHTEQTFSSMLGDLPVWLAAREQDTTAFMSSFQNLPDALEGFESNFGPYRWPRIGFVLVPFSSGAMEHASNIAYPLLAANGGTAFASLMAHELSHHWWGDLVTCSTAEDMWLNEGFASYCEALFFEHLEGEESYRNYVRETHKDVLTEAHLADGEYLPVSGISHEHTYGAHVYQKGADVLHTLRGYLGEDFFSLLTLFLEEHQYSAVSSEQLRDFLANETSANMEAFFDNWIFSPGYPEFRINDFDFTENESSFSYQISVEQHLHNAPELHTDVPLQISFLGENPFEEIYETDIIVSGSVTLLEIEVPFEASHIVLNRNEAIHEAVLCEEALIEGNGINNLQHAECRLNISNIPEGESAWIRVENHWAVADSPVDQLEFEVSTDRFWRIYHNLPEESNTSGRIRFYGNENASNYFDPTFFEEMASLNLNEDSLILLYRPFGEQNWIEHPNYNLSIQGINSDYQGYFDFDLLPDGDYAWAFRTGLVHHANLQKETAALYPNPSSGVLFTEGLKGAYQIYSVDGQLIETGNISNGVIDIHHLTVGCYLLKCDQRFHRFVKVAK